MVAKIYKKMYIHNQPFSAIVPVCYQMCLNVVFFRAYSTVKKTIGMSNQKQNRLSYKKIF